MAWDVTEITLEAHYVNAPSRILTLGCRSVSERAEEYYPDQQGGLDPAPRSVRRRRSLMVRGISPEDLDGLKGLNWEPYVLTFTDSRTGIRKSFDDVLRIDTPEPGTARFKVA